MPPLLLSSEFDPFQVAIIVTLVGYLWAAFHYYMSGRAAREGGDRKAQRVQPGPGALLRPSSPS